MSDGRGTEKATERERAYMARLGRYIEEENRAELEAHLQLSPLDRLRESVRLMQWGRDALGDDTEGDDPTSLFDRARSLGLYEP